MTIAQKPITSTIHPLIAAALAAYLVGVVACTDEKQERERTTAPCISADVGCAQAQETDAIQAEETPTELVVGADPDWLKDVTPLTDAEAVQFLNEQCADCHNTKNGSVRSFWPLEVETFDKAKLVTDTMAPTIYMALVMKAKDIVGGKPSAMPPRALKDTDNKSLLSLIKWMEVEVPAAASEAKTRYGNGDGTNGSVGVVLNFKCAEPATYRTYMRRVVNDAFSREPTAAELTFAGHDPDAKATLKDRQAVADRMFSDAGWKAEFVDKALRKFAEKVGGSADIRAIGGLTEPQAEDLKAEFYQLIRANWETLSFRDILLLDKVPVTTNTASLYEGCSAPASGWSMCDLKAPRGSYFTTASYLASKPSSFLRENNNYGRAALMHFIVRGDVFRAAFDQDGGAEVVKDLPACLKSKDFRGKKTGAQVAWRGAAAIPASANLCQSCHIERQMAAGSILFRPFSVGGMIFRNSAAMPGTVQLNQDPDFVAAVAPDIVNQVGLAGPLEVVDETFLQALLAGNDDEAACVPGRSGQPDTSLKTVKDLANYLVGDGKVLAGGLARHIPRAISNLDRTSEEIIVKVNDAFTAGNGKLGPVFRAYFASETYGCKK